MVGSKAETFLHARCQGLQIPVLGVDMLGTGRVEQLLQNLLGQVEDALALLDQRRGHLARQAIQRRGAVLGDAGSRRG